MNELKDKKRIAWITFPACIQTDIFIIPEIARYYQIDWYIISHEREKIDLFDYASQLKEDGIVYFEVIYIHNRLSSPKTAIEYARFLKRIKRKRYDAIYNVMIGVPYYMPLLKFYIGSKKVLVAIHNVHVPEGGNLYWPMRLYTRYTINSFKFFQTFSESQKKVLKLIAPRKYCDNVNFVLMDYGEPTIKKEHEIITFMSFGMIRDYKRVDVIIDAAQNVYEQTQKKFKVIIAGSCDNWSEYQKRIIYTDLFDLRIGWIDDKDVPNLFAEADYFVAPYQDIAQSGSSIIALNYNIPIIASRLESFETFIENGITGYLIRPASVEDLTSVMINILEKHLTVYDEMKHNIEMRKNALFSPESVCKLYRNNIETVLGS